MIAPPIKKSTAYTKPVPQRTCIACHRVAAKRALVRLVLKPDGLVEIDSKGKMAGRGAYLCAARSCWEEGLKTKKLEHALRTKLSTESLTGLLQHINDFSEMCPEGEGK